MRDKNENIVRKILKGDGEKRAGNREEGIVFILFKHSNIQTFKHFLN